MNLTETPETITWPETHYVFIEKIGPFMETAQKAWQELHALVPSVLEKSKITGYMSLYKFEPEMTYRAGVAVAAEPIGLPAGLAYEKFKGGKYLRFVLTGSYTNLPEACGRVFEIVSDEEIPLRKDYGVENYVNDPRTTPEDQLITEILVPTV